MSPGFVVGSEFLPGRSEHDFADVHVFRLAHRQDHHRGEGIRGDDDRQGLADVLRDVGFGDAVCQFGRDRPGEMTVVGMLYGLTSCRSPSEITRTAVLLAA